MANFSDPRCCRCGERGTCNCAAERTPPETPTAPTTCKCGHAESEHRALGCGDCYREINARKRGKRQFCREFVASIVRAPEEAAVPTRRLSPEHEATICAAMAVCEQWGARDIATRLNTLLDETQRSNHA